jgi:DNA-binding GntR family transcriptional regulator
MSSSNNLIRQRVLDELRTMLRDGRLQPGQRLLEADVVRAYGVSRSPVHFALESLRVEGRLARAPGRGYVVGRSTRTAGLGARAKVTTEAIISEPGWQRIYAQVEHEVATRILFRSFRIHEERLAEHFHVSRTVSRDVLARMHASGMITKDRGGHWYAERITADRIRDLYEIRRLLEPSALLDVAPRVPPETWSQMLAHLDAIARAFPNIRGADVDLAEQQLHVSLLSGCRNRELVRVLRQTQLLLISNRYLFDDYLGVPLGISEAALHEHRRVVSLARSGRYEAAADALREHLERSFQPFVDRLERIADRREPKRPAYVRPC